MTLLLLLFSTSTTFNNFQMDQDFYLFTSSMQLKQEDPWLTFGKILYDNDNVLKGFIEQSWIKASFISFTPVCPCREFLYW